jgi:hypothetical protein
VARDEGGVCIEIKILRNLEIKEWDKYEEI